MTDTPSQYETSKQAPHKDTMVQCNLEFRSLADMTQYDPTSEISMSLPSCKEIEMLCKIGIDRFLRKYASPKSIASLSLEKEFLQIIEYPQLQELFKGAPLLIKHRELHRILKDITLSVLSEADNKLDTFFDQQQNGNRWKENGHLESSFKSIRRAPWPTKLDILEMKVMTVHGLRQCGCEFKIPGEYTDHQVELYSTLNTALQIIVLVDCTQTQIGLAARLDASLTYLRQMGRHYRKPMPCSSFTTSL